MPRSQRTLSAQVILKPAAGGRAAADAAITAENVEQILPSQQAIEIARAAFAEAGFELGEVVANSFAITASAATFASAFKTRVSARAAGQPGGGETELPTSALPRRAREVVQAVVFTPPPDFGPPSP